MYGGIGPTTESTWTNPASPEMLDVSVVTVDVLTERLVCVLVVVIGVPSLRRVFDMNALTDVELGCEMIESAVIDATPIRAAATMVRMVILAPTAFCLGFMFR